mgnify:CR=1 FL=1
MSHNPIARYTWLYRLLSNKELTFSEINEHWCRSQFSENQPNLQKTYFKESLIPGLAENFGYVVSCKRAGKDSTYYIDKDKSQPSQTQKMLLDGGFLQETQKAYDSMREEYIFEEDYKPQMKYLDVILEAIKTQHCLYVIRRAYSEQPIVFEDNRFRWNWTVSEEIIPYRLQQYRGDWYLVAKECAYKKDADENDVKVFFDAFPLVFQIRNLESCEITQKTFKKPIDVASIGCEYFGMVSQDSYTGALYKGIPIKFTIHQDWFRKWLFERPIHCTQEANEDSEFSIVANPNKNLVNFLKYYNEQELMLLDDFHTETLSLAELSNKYPQKQWKPGEMWIILSIYFYEHCIGPEEADRIFAPTIVPELSHRVYCFSDNAVTIFIEMENCDPNSFLIKLYDSLMWPKMSSENNWLDINVLAITKEHYYKSTPFYSCPISDYSSREMDAFLLNKKRIGFLGPSLDHEFDESVYQSKLSKPITPVEPISESSLKYIPLEYLEAIYTAYESDTDFYFHKDKKAGKEFLKKMKSELKKRPIIKDSENPFEETDFLTME